MGPYRKWVWWALAVIAAAFLLTLTDGPFPVSKTGTLGEWIGGVGTAVGVLIAATAYRGDLQDRTEERHRHETERLHSSRIPLTFDLSYTSEVDPPYEMRLVVRIHNGSEFPIRGTGLSSVPVSGAQALPGADLELSLSGTLKDLFADDIEQDLELIVRVETQPSGVVDRYALTISAFEPAYFSDGEPRFKSGGPGASLRNVRFLDRKLVRSQGLTDGV